jgi:uncharacterized RDD family membrane protein YckC
MASEVKLSKRISAYFLDILLIYLFISLITSIKVINPYYDKYTEETEKYTELMKLYTDKEIDEKEFLKESREVVYYLSKYSVSSNIVIAVVIVAYFGLFQKFNKGQTLGKKIMRIKVTSNDDKELSLLSYLLRLLASYHVFIGNIIVLIANSVLINYLDVNKYYNANMIVTYVFFGIAIISFVMILIREDKRGLHDVISNTKVINE